MSEGTPLVHQSITGALGVQGWGHLDPVLLAALATESPLLLVGPHGTAKSLLIERIAVALGLEMRHYNASLLNYDDLVGIPLPEEDGNSLRFVATPGAIWDAEFVFFDEISRCRPDLQNKLFPIIHERRLVGIPLSQLRHRWSAMNPPAPEDTDTTAQTAEYYLGSEPLDPALADRFPFVVPVPSWKNLSKADQRRVVSWRGESAQTGAGNERPLSELVIDCAQIMAELEEQLDDWLVDYVVCVVDLLEQAKLPQSPRRARMLARSIVAVQAARMVLEGQEADLESSAEIALMFGLPQNAAEVPPSQSTVVAAHKQAWEIASHLDDENWRQVFQERDLVRRVVLADQLHLGDEDLSRLITQALAGQESEARLLGLGTAMFLAFRERRNLAPSAWEPLAQFAARLIEPRNLSVSAAANGPEINIWNAVREWLINRKNREGTLNWLERNYILAGFPDLWRRYNWKEALESFRTDLTLFGIQE
jgi:MoxR-like ATPase